MIPVKSAREIAQLERANAVVLRVLEILERMIEPGVTTEDLNHVAEAEARKRGGVPAFKGYRGFPKSLCASINDEVVHGIPSKKRKVAEADIVSLDFGVLLDGYYGDAAITVGVGKISPEATRLIETTRTALGRGIAEAVSGASLSNVGAAIEAVAQGAGYGVVRDFVGHGIGTALHEDPQVPNYGPPGRGPKLREGMVFAIEPMINTGTGKVVTDPDGWTVRTADGGLSAHFEYSIAITAEGPKVLGSLVPVEVGAMQESRP